MSALPLVSIVIPTFNSSKTLGLCLESVRNQDYDNVEIIVVDNNSSDSTKEIAEKFTPLVFNAWPERTAQKNFGIRKSSGEYLFFVDSDMVLSPEVVTECVNAMSDASVGGVRVPETSEGERAFVKVRDFERSFYAGTDVESARFFRKSDVEKVGGFEEDLIFFEESLLPQKIEKLLNLPCKASVRAAIRHQEGNVRLGSWLKKKYYYGKSLGKYRQKVLALGMAGTHAGQTGVFRRYGVFLGNRRFYSRPCLAVGVLVLKTSEFAAGGLGYLFSQD